MQESVKYEKRKLPKKTFLLELFKINQLLGVLTHLAIASRMDVGLDY